jgi:3-oxoacyl-[acyl-carrier protein] reductase
MTVELNGRVAIVTGAAQGIGEATARKLKERGARVVGIDIEGDKLEQVMNSIDGMAIVQDVTDAEGDQRAVDEVFKEFGRIDILANVAGGTLGAGRGIEELTLEDWHKVVALNMHAPLYLAKAVAPIMKRQQWGRIISVGSGAGRSHSRSRVVPYAAAKAGLMGMMRQIAVDLAPYGVLCNTVGPGLILSDRGREEWAQRSDESKKEQLLTIAIDRLGEPIEIANMIAFLASEEASYVVGQTIMVDGGHWMF